MHLFADWTADQGVDDRTGIVIPADLPVGAEGQFPPIRVPLFQDRERSLYANGGSFKIFRVSKTNQQYIIIFDNPSLTVDGFEQVIPRDGSTGANVTLVSTTANPRLDAQIRERACESHGALPRMDNPFGGCVPDTAFVEAELGLRPGSSGLLA